MEKVKVGFHSEGQKIVGTIYKPNVRNGRAVIMCHGFTGRKGKSPNEKFIKAAEVLCKNGFAVLMFDFRGSGKKRGQFFGCHGQERGRRPEGGNAIRAREWLRKNRIAWD